MNARLLIFSVRQIDFDAQIMHFPEPRRRMGQHTEQSVRTLAGLDPAGGPSKDDILYPLDGPSVFMHPFCVNTFRNGSHVGEETPATTY